MKIKENGITLISLVITIIVLLILAGISIPAITGKHGIISNAIDAKNKAEIAEIEEEARRVYIYLFKNNDEPTLEDVCTELINKGKYNIQLKEQTQKKYYAIVNEKYYEITLENDEIYVSREQSNI